MTRVTVKLTAQELDLLVGLAADQLFRREFYRSSSARFQRESRGLESREETGGTSPSGDGSGEDRTRSAEKARRRYERRGIRGERLLFRANLLPGAPGDSDRLEGSPERNDVAL